MSSFTIRPLLDEEQDLEAAVDYGVEYDRALFGAVARRTPEELLAQNADTPYWRQHHWIAIEGARVVGEAAVRLPLQENTDLAHVEISVRQDARGRGIGGRLLDEVVAPALAQAGRARVEVYGEFAAREEIDDSSHPVNRMAARLGVVRKNIAVCSVAPLPLPADTVAALEHEVAERSGGYETLLWERHVPDEFLEGYGALLHQLELDEPDEDVVSEAPDYTPERIRTMEQRREASGVFPIIAVARARDGSLAAHSEVVVSVNEGTDLAIQENTLVFEAHRGHRLGLALKLVTHRALVERFPDVRRIATWNSHVNPWMIEVNERMGYEPTYFEVAFQTP